MLYYKQHFNFIEPQRVVLDINHVQKMSGRKRRTIEKKKEVFYVPLLATLKCLLENDVVRNEVITGHRSCSGILKDYCDGNCFMIHPLYTSDPSALQIILYYDELELCNPLGSRHKIHKVGNINPKLSSKVSSIQLVCIAKSSVIDEFGIDTVLRPFINGLKTLEKGVTFDIKGQSYMFRGTISIISADNPASQLLGGFKQSHSAFRKCRHCLCVDSEIQTKESQIDLRSVQEHQRQCSKLDHQDLYQHYSVTNGINRRSELDECDYFQVASGALVPDIMHDILEGALPLEIKLMSKHFVSQRLISLQIIDRNFDLINLLYMDKCNKPSPLSGIDLNCNDSSLKQHAMQMWTYYDNLFDELPYGLYLPPFMSSSDSCRFIVTKNIMYES